MPAAEKNTLIERQSTPPVVDVIRLLEDVREGELVVRSPDGTGRVHVVDGRIAWVFIADALPRFPTRLMDAGLVSSEELTLVLNECRRSGGNFSQLLVEWGLVAREVLRGLLREHFADGLTQIVSWRAPQALFLPQTRSFSSDFTFALEELTRPQPTVPTLAGTATEVGRPMPRQAQLEYIVQNVKTSLEDAMKIDGAIAAALVDYESGMALGTAGGNADFDVEVAAAGNTEVVRAKLRVAKQLGLPGGIEDMLITLSTQYHLIRPLRSQEGLFFYVALDRARANLGMARFQLAQIESKLEL